MTFRSIAYVFIAVLASSAAQAGIYDDPENLKVLPEDISSEQLQETMRSFALDVGLRCSSCHKGEEGQDLKEYDFASDDEELKDKAREMLKMVAAINQDHLSGLGDDRLQVTCLTCHRGVSKPKSIGQVLAGAASEEGIPAMRSTYDQLKEEYYGAGAYNFSEFNLGQVARERSKAGHSDQARAVLDIMLDEYPQSFTGHFFYGELMMRSGDNDLARKYMEKALELNPEAAPFIKPRLEQLNK